jgi:hypothetical protein
MQSERIWCRILSTGFRRQNGIAGDHLEKVSHYVSEWVDHRDQQRKPKASGHYFQGPVIIAVTPMRVMEVSTNEIVNVVPVRHAFMSASRTVSVPLIVTFASMIWRASTRIEVAH